ncbi:MAG TPA: peptide MFS transporter [Gemmatimonadaceae bacterium]|nr:peptide MFS transporter [Gemmatimonadaceae bacterium]
MPKRDRDVFEQPSAGTVTLDEPPPAIGRGVSERRFFGHPVGLSTLFFTEMWERFSYYGIRPLLVLFMTAALTQGGFGFERSTASSIVGIYAACVYLASLPGGWIADRWLGLRRSIWYGGIFIALGHLSIALSIVFEQSAFFIGLILIVIGTGLLKPNVSAIVGDLYPEGGSRRDAGFSIFYMGINTGALVAPLITGVLGEKVGWHLGFGAAGVGMVIGLITYRMRADKTLGDIGTTPASTDPREHRRVKLSSLIGIGVIALLVVLTMAGVIHINPVSLAEKMSLIMLGLALLYFIYLFVGGGLTTEEKKRVVVIILLFFFATVFWAAFEQAPTSLNLFARDYTNRVVFGWEMPTLWLQAANSVFVIALAPVFAWVWIALGKRGKDPSSVAKFAWGLFFAGVGFVVMWEAANIIINNGGNIRVSPWWLVWSYFFQSVGELSLSPVGLSSMTKLAPFKFKGQMMGVWFMASALGNLIAGLVGGKVDPEKLNEMPALFRQTSISLFIAAIVCGLLVFAVRRMMKGVPAGQR